MVSRTSKCLCVTRIIFVIFVLYILFEEQRGFRKGKHFHYQVEVDWYYLPFEQKIPPMKMSINDVSSNRYTARCSTILNQGHVWRSPMMICGDMQCCIRVASVIVVLGGGDLTILPCAYQLSGRNELLPRFGHALVSCKLPTVSFTLMVTATDMKTP